MVIDVVEKGEIAFIGKLPLDESKQLLVGSLNFFPEVYAEAIKTVLVALADYERGADNEK